MVFLSVAESQLVNLSAEKNCTGMTYGPCGSGKPCPFEELSSSARLMKSQKSPSNYYLQVIHQSPIIKGKLPIFQSHLNNVLTEMGSSNKDNSMENQDLALTVCAQKHGIEQCHDKMNYLTDLLNQAKSEFDRIVTHSHEIEKKLEEAEKQCMTLKFDRGSDLILQRSPNYSLELQRERLENCETEFEREEEFKFYQAKYEKLKNSNKLLNSSRVGEEQNFTSDAIMSTDNKLQSEQPREISSVSEVYGPIQIFLTSHLGTQRNKVKRI